MDRNRRRKNLLSFKDTNCQHKSINFDYIYSTSQISHCDILVFKNSLNSLSIKLYTKPTDIPAYLHVIKRKHLIWIIHVIQKKIYIEEDLDKALNELKCKFIERL